MMRKTLLFSCLLNAALVAMLLYGIGRLGGGHYVWQRLWQDASSAYVSRKSLFEALPAQPGAIVFLGDSQIEQGEWGEFFREKTSADTLLATRNPQPAIILNRGISGDHVAAVMARLPEVLRHKPVAIFLLVGVNDLIYGKTPDEVATLYRELVQRIQREVPQALLVVVSLLPVNEGIRNVGIGNESVRALNARLLQIAQEMDLKYADAFSPLADDAGNLDGRFTEDGLHLNGPGYLALWQALR